VDTADPYIFAAAAGLMMLVGVMANLLPALRATRVDPVTVLNAG
jgi:ABC-type antimicrobial peptide transport system permease subunit